MPAIQSATVGSDLLKTTINGVQSTLNVLTIPSTNVAQVETWLNNTYLPSIAGAGVHLVAHVFSTVPLMIALWSGDVGVNPSANWWIISK